ncbi:Protein NRT1/ PTR FAMILY 2.8 [Linum perenne]
MAEQETHPLTSPPPPSSAATPPQTSPIRKTAAGGWRAIKFILGNESFEKLASMSLIANLTLYLQSQYNMGGVFNVTVTTVWGGTCNVASLAGAFLADSYLGRFRTLLYGSISSFLGIGAMTLTAAIPQLRPPPCKKFSSDCQEPQGWQLAFLFGALGLLSIGAGGIRPCNIAFGADQFDTSTPKGRSQLECFFNWWYFCFSVSLAVALTAVVYIQTEISWLIGFAIPTACFIVSISIFLIGRSSYILNPPQGAFTNMAKVISAAFKKRRIRARIPTRLGSVYNPPNLNSNSKLDLTDRFRFLNRAAVIVDSSEIDEDGNAVDPWRLCSVQQVEELKCLAATMPVWASGIFCFMPMEQQTSFGVLQAIQIDRSIGKNFNVPPGWAGLMSMVTLSIWILTYERILMPMGKRITGKSWRMTISKRIKIGILLSILGMVIAGNVERKRRDMALAAGEFVSPVSFAVLIPQFVVSGLSEAFAAVAVMEYFTTRIPESMRTVAGALFFLCLAGTGYVSSLVVNVIHRTSGGGGKTPWLGGHDLNKNRLDYYYYTIAGLACLNFIYFHLIASRFATEDDGGGRRREEDELENAGGNGGGGEASEHKAGGALISGDAC